MKIDQVTETGATLESLLDKNRTNALRRTRIREGMHEMPYRLTFTNQDNTENVYIENIPGWIADENTGTIIYPGQSITIRAMHLADYSLATAATKTNSNVRVIGT